MTNQEFKNLRHGNVVKSDGGLLYVVKQVTRDENDNALYIGLAPAIDISDAGRFEIVSKSRQITYISGRTLPE